MNQLASYISLTGPPQIMLQCGTQHGAGGILSALFRPIPEIRKFQYFRMESSSPVVVTVKVNKDAAEQQSNIHKCGGLGLNGQSFYKQRD